MNKVIFTFLLLSSSINFFSQEFLYYEMIPEDSITIYKYNSETLVRPADSSEIENVKVLKFFFPDSIKLDESNPEFSFTGKTWDQQSIIMNIIEDTVQFIDTTHNFTIYFGHLYQGYIDFYGIAELSSIKDENGHDIIRSRLILDTDSIEAHKNQLSNPDDSLGIIHFNYRLKKFEDYVTIPDANFLDVLIFNGIDTNEDGQISYSEAEKVTSLSVSNWEISDLTGIEAFVNLENLECMSNQLTSIDISACTKLISLHCPKNQISTLDLSKNIELTWLNCSQNQLTTLDVSKNTKLDYLICSRNNLTSLDISNNIALIELDCAINDLVNLDVTKNTQLKKLHCWSNQLTSLDVSNNIDLDYLFCTNNKLSSLDLSKNTQLEELYCANSLLSNFIISNNPYLKKLDCTNNQLTILDVSANNSLISLYCGDNQIASLDLRYNTLLEVLELSKMPSLYQVCVWELPFPSENYCDTTGSPNVYFTTDCSIGIKPNNLSNLSIYPNPTTSFLNIESNQTDHYSIEILTLSGQLIYRTEMEETSKQIDMIQFKNGIYLVRLRSKDFIRFEKVVKF